MNKNKGFTLIELMVVIVIIGILAAVAIPKLFGMSAKAKAAEIPTASASYERLQVAYAQQPGVTNVGGPKDIGYEVPVSKTLNYDTTAGAGILTIKGKTKLNECDSSATFKTTVTFNGGKPQSTHLMSDSANCKVLVPGWNKITAADI